MTSLKSHSAERLFARVQQGDAAALGRALTLAEVGGAEGQALMAELEGRVGQARIVGFTGPPGAGKSTLVDVLIHEWRSAGKKVAVLAVDPVSPISGGAVLGDRTRMGAHTMDDGVFIRSISARGHLGGLSAAAHDMADVMDAAGWPLILIETVGAGQSETEISELADLSVVISAPGLGDELQAIKAGILEIGDILVVNKADREDAEQAFKNLQNMLALRSEDRRDVPVLKTSATSGEGVAELAKTINDLMAARPSGRVGKRNARKVASLSMLLASRITAGIPDEDLPNLRQSDLDRVVQESMAKLKRRSEE